MLGRSCRPTSSYLGPTPLSSNKTSSGTPDGVGNCSNNNNISDCRLRDYKDCQRRWHVCHVASVGVTQNPSEHQWPQQSSNPVPTIAYFTKTLLPEQIQTLLVQVKTAPCKPKSQRKTTTGSNASPQKSLTKPTPRNPPSMSRCNCEKKQCLSPSSISKHQPTEHVRLQS